jgi:hypothetical protein
MTHDNEQAEIDAAIEAAWETIAAPHPRDILKREHDRILRGHRRDVALEKWEPMLDGMMMRDLELIEPCIHPE